jgi:hypothetical protein
MAKLVAVAAVGGESTQNDARHFLGPFGHFVAAGERAEAAALEALEKETNGKEVMYEHAHAQAHTHAHTHTHRPLKTA